MQRLKLRLTSAGRKPGAPPPDGASKAKTA
jgi:hypothetical protein